MDRTAEFFSTIDILRASDAATAVRPVASRVLKRYVTGRVLMGQSDECLRACCPCWVAPVVTAMPPQKRIWHQSAGCGT